MRTWVLYKRKHLLGKKGIDYSVDILKGKFDENKPKTERRIAPGKSPTDLAKLVATDFLIKDINPSDLIVSLERTIFIPSNQYIDIPATPEEITEFYEAYKKLTSGA